jgi:hypothetical protein
MRKTSKKIISFIFGTILLAGGIDIVLIKSQSPKVICERATTPWKIEDFAIPNEYIAGYFPNVEIAQFFRQEVAQGLAFCLRPFSYMQNGWSIVMSTDGNEDCDVDLSSPVTLPMHGWTPRDVFGSYFANQSDTEEIIGNMEEPVAKREFSFVFGYEDYKRIEENWACWVYGLNCPSDWENTSETPRSRGIFAITKLKLGNFTTKDQAWIEEMDFVVKIYLPADSSLNTK